MSRDDHDFRVRPGRGRDAGVGSARRAAKLGAQVKRAAARSGFTRSRPGGGRGGGTGRHGRGRQALAAIRRGAAMRRVTVMARIVRHKGASFRAAPLGRHIAYLERDGVTRDGREASMFDASSDAADRTAFAARCGDDRHHFRLIVSPEDAADIEDLRSFTRDLMRQVEADLATRLDWVAVDHWNTDNPHIHILVRGVDGEGADLVVDRAYIAEGIRGRASELATLELGPRTERTIDAARAREVMAERWTSLDADLAARADETGLIDLRPVPGAAAAGDRHLLGRAAELEKLGLASSLGPAVFIIDPRAEGVLRDLALRGDIIKTIHREMRVQRLAFDAGAIMIHGGGEGPVIGRLVARGLDDELTGSAYAIVDGVDGRAHHLRFADLDWTGDAAPGAIVELRGWDTRDGKRQISLALRSDLPLAAQVTADGATWLDRRIIARDASAAASGFGAEVQRAMEIRVAYLEGEGLMRREGQRLVPQQGLIETLKQRELEAAGAAIGARTGLVHCWYGAGESVSGIYRERVSLASGRFAMIDDGRGFQLVPWRPALDRHLGKHVAGTAAAGGGIDWTIGRGRGLGI